MIHRLARIAALVVPLAALAPVSGLAADKDPVVAVVNGAEIRLSDIEEARSLLPDEYRKVPLQMVYEPLLMSLIDVKVAAAAATALKLDQTDSVKRALARTHDQVLQRALITKEMDEKLGDEALRARYEELSVNASGDEQVRARHILVKTKAEGEAVIKELKGGADFAKLARDKSQDNSKASGGDLGYFTREEMVPPFAEAAFALAIGKYTETPVESQFGWHVILVEDRKEGVVPSFENVRDALRQEMTSEVISKLMEELRKGADIKRFNADGSPM